jgi:mannose-6-phosphate isomerase-like protein (cupin superfamily)
MSVGAKVVRIEDVGPIPVVDGALQWHPLRKRLDVRAFGINAYTAESAGDEVVESHDESDLGHEEIYVVLTGRATFTVAGEQLDVPAGSLVHLADPSLRRHAVAAEPQTTVLAIGGKPGEPFRPSAWEHYFEAGAAVAAGDAESAYRIAAAGLVDHPDHPALLFNIACYAALAGHPDEAMEMLCRALEVAPDRVRVWAADDSDLDTLRSREDWPL